MVGRPAGAVVRSACGRQTLSLQHVRRAVRTMERFVNRDMHMAVTHRFQDMTWPEVNDAVERGVIPLLPVGTVEQHGHHLPVKIDNWTSTEICEEAAKRSDGRITVMPSVSYGYTSHVMDFPGTITIHHETFIRYVLDILKSLACQGFKKIIMVNGHGSNMNPLELAARRAMVETDAWVGIGAWWHFMAADPEFMSTWRESEVPGGCAHAGEAETSLALFFDDDMVKMDLAKDQITWTNQQKSKYHWNDLWATGPVRMDGWTSTYTTDGTQGQPTLATAEKGRRIFEESVNNIVEFAGEFAAREMPARVDHHGSPPTVPLPG